MNNIKTAFFGTDEIAVFVLEELKKENIIPDLIVSTPDTKKGRGMKLTPTPLKIWSEENNIEVIQPDKLDFNFKEQIGLDWDLFIVTSYGKIVPEDIFTIPKYETLNVHPSLLPLYRGPSPIESAILDDALDTGVTIMKIDKGVDSGPILNQKIITFDEWELKPKVAEKLAREGGQLLAKTIPLWIEGSIEEQDQDDQLSTHTEKISKSDGQLNIQNGDTRKNYLKYLAFQPWPGVFFFKDGKRIKITDAEFIPSSDASSESQGEFLIKKVIPEGKKEQEYKN